MHKGNVLLKFDVNDYILKGGLYVPGLKKNLISIQKIFRDLKYVIEFDHDNFVVKDPTLEIWFVGHSQDGLYHIYPDAEAFYLDRAAKSI